MSVDHDEATRIAQGYGTTYTSPSDDAVRKVFAAYLELRAHVLDIETNCEVLRRVSDDDLSKLGMKFDGETP